MTTPSAILSLSLSGGDGQGDTQDLAEGGRGEGGGRRWFPSLPDLVKGRPGEGSGGGGGSPPSQIRPEGGRGRAAAVAAVPLPLRSGRREAGGGQWRQQRPHH
ncbi:hypothetical protein [Oryza sativa Japonica Group]|uniref:Uncharacterized protein P0415C01.17 n=1 Tax=Oryza sativa subsp. japonica TaxID=39947 RepID=Q8S262_ORYSJ|nr:hypothetical protein [Oryza sativa Japonica Group]